MQTWITGGTIPNADQEARCELPLENLMEWELAYMVAKHRMIIMLYTAFTPINLPRFLPSKRAVANCLNLNDMNEFARIFNSVITESAVYEEIDLSLYTAEKDLKRCGAIIVEATCDPREYREIKEWREDSLRSKSKLSLCFANLWPTKLSCPRSQIFHTRMT